MDNLEHGWGFSWSDYWTPLPQWKVRPVARERRAGEVSASARAKAKRAKAKRKAMRR